MNRRKFIRISSLSLGAAALSCKAASVIEKSGVPSRVIVIGAGMSGIAAAYFLRKQNIEVEIIEANERLGGRIWTDRSSGTPLDMGAGWIEGDMGNPLYKIADRHGIKTLKSNYGNTYAFDENGIIGDEEALGLYKKAKKIYNDTRHYGKYEKGKDKSVQDIIDLVKKDYSLTAREEQALNWYVSTVEVDFACRMSEFSFYLQTKSDGFYGDDRVIPEGYDQLPAALAKDITINYGQRVSEISDNGSSVTVSCSSGKTFSGDYAIVSVPLGVLKSGNIVFSPRLPEWKQNAINNMGMGKLYKIAIGYTDPFWPHDRDNLSYMNSVKGTFPVFLNWKYYTGKNYLVTAVGGDFMESLKGKDDAEIGKMVSLHLGKMLKQNVPDPDFMKVARWGENENSYGAYSFTPVGTDGNKTSDALAENCGRIYFAGEATIKKYPATVHGAFYSGEREAGKIIALVNN